MDAHIVHFLQHILYAIFYLSSVVVMLFCLDLVLLLVVEYSTIHYDCHLLAQEYYFWCIFQLFSYTDLWSDHMVLEIRHVTSYALCMTVHWLCIAFCYLMYMCRISHLVGWAIAMHGMYESALVFWFKFKMEELVHSGLWMWHLGHNSIFTFARIEIKPRLTCTCHLKQWPTPQS